MRSRRAGGANPRIGRSYWTLTQARCPLPLPSMPNVRSSLARATLDIEARALDALKERQGEGFVAALARDPRLHRARRRDGHGQERPRRPQGGGDAGLDRHAGVLRPPRRSEPRRPRHGDRRRRRPRDLQLAARATRSPPSCRRSSASASRLIAMTGNVDEQPRPPCRHRPLERGRPGGVPAEPGADREHDGADGARRRARRRAARCARLSRGGLRALASRRQPRPQAADARRRPDAQRRRRAARRCRHA